jgi:hypothetical protein
VPNVRLTDALVVVAIIVLMGGGLATLTLCGGGASLVLFGAAVVLLGVALGRSGGWALIIPISIAALTLVAAGWFVAGGAGCGL